MINGPNGPSKGTPTQYKADFTSCECVLLWRTLCRFGVSALSLADRRRDTSGTASSPLISTASWSTASTAIVRVGARAATRICVPTAHSRSAARSRGARCNATSHRRAVRASIVERLVDGTRLTSSARCFASLGTSRLASGCPKGPPPTDESGGRGACNAAICVSIDWVLTSVLARSSRLSPPSIERVHDAHRDIGPIR